MCLHIIKRTNGPRYETWVVASHRVPDVAAMNALAIVTAVA